MRRGMFPGSGMNINKLMQEAKKMQADLEKKQNDIAAKEFETTSGGGMVYVKINGNKKILDLKIKEEIVDPEDISTLQDLILVALNDVFEKVDKEIEGSMGNFNLPGF